MFKVTDSSAASDTATIDITVTSVNDTPTAADASLTTIEDTAASVDIIANDVDGDTLELHADVSDRERWNGRVRRQHVHVHAGDRLRRPRQLRRRGQ